MAKRKVSVFMTVADSPEEEFVNSNMSLKMCVLFLKDCYELNTAEALSMLQSNDSLLTPQFGVSVAMFYIRHRL